MSAPEQQSPITTCVPLARSASSSSPSSANPADSSNSTISARRLHLPTLRRQTTLARPLDQQWRVELSVISASAPRVMCVRSAAANPDKCAASISDKLSPITPSEHAWSIDISCSTEIPPAVLAIKPSSAETLINLVEQRSEGNKPTECIEQTDGALDSLDLAQVKALLVDQMEKLSIAPPSTNDEKFHPPPCKSEWSEPPPPNKTWSLGEIQYELQCMGPNSGTARNIWTPDQFDAIVRSEK